MQEDTIAMAFSMMNARQKQRFKDEFEIDIAYSVPGLGRFRCNIFQQRGTVGLVLRVIPGRILTIRELMLPPVLEKICEEQRGLVLCTGTTGSGKSTTLAAMIDYINGLRTEHIVTIEDPIEFLHRDKKSIVNQREIDVDTRGFADRPALGAAPGPRRHPGRRDARLRDDRDRAARGRDRPPGVLDPAHPRRHRDDQPHHLGLPAAPPEADPHPARAGPQGGDLAAPAAARRRHRPRAGGRGHDRRPPYIRDCIENKEKTKYIREQIALGTSQYGMQTFDQSLFQLYKAGLITLEEAMKRATNPDEFKLKLQGVQFTSDAAREQMESSLEGVGGFEGTGSPFEIERIEGPKR